MRPDDPDNYTVYQLETGPYIENWYFHDRYTDEVSGPFCSQHEAMREVYRAIDDADLEWVGSDEPGDESLDEFDDAEPMDSEVDPPSRVLQLPLF